MSVSADGVTWQEIPLDIHEPFGAGTAEASVHGNTIFVTSNEDGGTLTMWVGAVGGS